MNFCETSSILKIFMYFKYIILFSLILFFICFLLNKKDKLLKKINIVLFIFIVIYSLLFLTYIFNMSLKQCFINSNPKSIYQNTKLNRAYNSNNIYYSYDQSSNSIKPTSVKKMKNKDLDINIFNVNYYPISNVKFNLEESSTSFSLKKSGNEIATLSSILSSLEYTDEINPMQIIETLRYSEIMDKNNFSMDHLLSVIYPEYDFQYSEIYSSQVEDAIRKGGIVIAKVHGAEDGIIFTCSESYIFIYNIDNDNNYYVANVNDNDYNIICPVNSLGFGNVVKSNINDSLYLYDDIMTNSDRFYVLWR